MYSFQGRQFYDWRPLSVPQEPEFVLQNGYAYQPFVQAVQVGNW